MDDGFVDGVVPDVGAGLGGLSEATEINGHTHPFSFEHGPFTGPS